MIKLGGDRSLKLGNFQSLFLKICQNLLTLRDSWKGIKVFRKIRLKLLWKPVKQNFIKSMIGKSRVLELEACVTGTKKEKNLVNSS